ncbi:MAG: mannose-1-phosphate guanylyltransferase/mannose-6-phosphate isomerase, partial [candidate division NC10 bacterium]|nr:mannose-1-phosphate guanylyltransferase/mannose-6-phosphate isomerase [candidate division NC10 bacterium]
ERHALHLKGQVTSIAQGYRFLLEPEMKNTAPAIGLAALSLEKEDPQAIMAAMPADHWVRNPSQLLHLLQVATAPAERNFLVTFGVPPTRPETGFGYLKASLPLPGLDPSLPEVLQVEAFVEKPDLNSARAYLANGNFYWNSGIFVWKASTILREIREHLPLLYGLLQQIRPYLGTPQEKQALVDAYGQMEAISIDYGVMEKSKAVALIEAEMGWHDVGTYNALDELCPKDPSGNIKSGNLLDLDSQDSILLASSRILATVGLQGMVVVDTEDATLICPKEKTQQVRRVAEELKRKGLEEGLIHRTVLRPWGQYTVLGKGEGYKIKRIVVEPGARLSLQLHRRRSEHWVVLSGRGKVRIEDRSFEIYPHQSTFIPVSAKHRLENPGPEPLHIIEAQIGEYVEEDDIERFDDEYGRSG